MASPKYDIIQTTYQNPDATMGLKMSVMVVSNTTDDEINANIKSNAQVYHKWAEHKEAHDGVAILIGGGDSINDHIDDIKQLKENGATIYGLNAASKWARDKGISVDYQVIVDAKEETAKLVDKGAKAHLFASQCNWKTTVKATDLTLFHLASTDIESHFPPERVEQGGYVLLGGGSTVGSIALALTYSQGFRQLHLFGYDSSYKDGKSHGYNQSLNNFMPTTEIEWAGNTFEVSVAMKAQAEKFPIFSNVLKQLGCELHVYGEGLLQTIYNTKYEDLSEREKYQLMWQLDTYRAFSPGESIAEFFLNEFHPGRGGTIIDYGCGTGRAGAFFKEKGHNVILMDFADNCRDEEALSIPFVQHDLTKPSSLTSEYGFCTDVMEHIPTEDVGTVIDNIMASSGRVFFQISTIDDAFGEVIEQPLHLTVKPHGWWRELFISNGYTVEWENEQATAALFYVINPDRREACQ